jgi:hypothetical protein
MDRSIEEARQLMYLEEARLRQLSYDELQRLETPIVKELVAESGNTYEIEIETIWDDRRKKNVRVLLHIEPWWGWGWLIPRKLTIDFIMAPDGSFVGE